MGKKNQHTQKNQRWMILSLPMLCSSLEKSDLLFEPRLAIFLIR